MHDAFFPLYVCVKCSCEILFKLGPPHVWRLFAFIEKGFEHFIGLAYVDCVNANTFIVFNYAFKSFASVLDSR